jgi:hypothetical protein
VILLKTKNVAGLNGGVFFQHGNRNIPDSLEKPRKIPKTHAADGHCKYSAALVPNPPRKKAEKCPSVERDTAVKGAFERKAGI